MAGRLDVLERALGRHAPQGEIRCTEAPGHAVELAATAAAEGFEGIVAVGGDGTANEVVNGLFDDAGEARRPEVVFGVVHGGTGGDLVKTLGIPADLDEAVRVACTATPRACDVVRVRLTSPQGDPVQRMGINVTGFGANGEVVRRANQSSKRLGGRLTFLGATLRTVATYRPPQVAVRWEDPSGRTGEWEGALQSAFVANGRYCGGGMLVGPRAAMDDGLADLTLIGDLGTVRMALNGHRLFTGTIGNVKGVSTARIRHLWASCRDGTEVLVDVDGEQPGRLPLELDIRPAALLVAGVWAAG
jgi:diacylglycerol kinase family enzyme